MPERQGAAQDESFFNDLSQRHVNDPSRDVAERHGSPEGQGDNAQVPKPKRIACVLCRKRKLKCDGTKPSCGTCTRLQHDCSYDEVRKKSGPKRGYVKALEARLAQVETLLKTQDDHPMAATNRRKSMLPNYDHTGLGTNLAAPLGHEMPSQSQQDNIMPGAAAVDDQNVALEDQFPWEMIGLGLEEPLPTQDVIDELNQVFFEKVHPSLPMIHRPRYYAAMNLAPHMRPPICLRYAMWASAAAVTDKYEALQEHFYQRARRYIQQDEMKGHGESLITVAHCQAWALLATYEFKRMYFPRAWMSSGRASRMALMMGLHRLDGNGLDVKQCLSPPKDWTEREERRRTFWMCFCIDRYSSIGTGWPMTIEERDILTNLPADEDAYELSRPARTMSLSGSMEPQATPSLTPFAGVIVMACLFGKNLTHLHRPDVDDREGDLDGNFWRRHRNIENMLLNIALGLPDPLRLPAGLNNANTVFMNMSIHTSTICLHQAAIFKAEKNRMPARIAAECKVRCVTAAAEIANVMRQISHLDLAALNPFISFCLYVAARVFVQYLKARSRDAQVRASLQFLLSAMHAIKRKNPLTESFLVQLDIDLESARLEDPGQFRAQLQVNKTAPRRSPPCSQSHLGMPDTTRQPTFGDHGLPAFQAPNKPEQQSSQEHGEIHNGVNGRVVNGTATQHLELPNRQRDTPGSLNGPSLYQSPNHGLVAEMDTSPDASGDQRTPGSSTQSCHNGTSSTAYSPQNRSMHRNGTPADTAPMTAEGSVSLADFDLSGLAGSTYPVPPSGFAQDWTDSVGTGMSPGVMGTGMTHDGINDLVNGMSDSDWNVMLESLASNGWETGMADPPSMMESVRRG
ncbi:hypothetical protein CERZMDRAFT_106468 [Cercospora zeae-maydis SCOH1-5]|uniref:Zn(2)-C6 fungal-type domain-containing protein n=1 Tax=Cercospora zeae-maydis SCOH1-5 TaxID=717836 RepID=A0A6A6FDX5_9PEZI|nr:hypothetical protein CERZMDRAFT_106468 [Cercospora zeae-maydis SCOH1-5]